MKKNIIVVLLLFVMNCRSLSFNFAVASTKHVDFSKNYEKIKDQAVGSHSISIFFVFPSASLSITESINKSLEKALQDSDSDFLKNVEIYDEFYYIPFIYGQIKVVVVGEAWKEVPAKKK